MLELRAVLGYNRFITSDGEIITGKEAVRRGKKTKLTYKQLKEKYPESQRAIYARIIGWACEGRFGYCSYPRMTEAPRRKSRNK